MHKLFCFALAALCIPCHLLFAQSPWELKKDKDSIRVYSRTVKDSKFNDLKGTFNLRGDFLQLCSILEDVNNYKSWVYSTKSSMLIEKKAAGNLIYYCEISAPWPISNRDFYSNIKIWCDSATGQLHISSRNVSGDYPVKNHLVRIPYLKADWSVTKLSPGWLHIEYTLGWDPGGSIPAWVANMFSTAGPFESFSELKKKMALMNQ